MSGIRGAAAQPLYQQIKERIVARITSGEWPPGRRIPSENQLVRSLGVSRMTVHRALRELAAEGRLDRVAGVGTFVAEPPRHASLIELRNIADEVAAEGRSHSARLLHLGRERCDQALAERMETRPGTELAHVTLLHLADELPIQLEDRWVSLELVPDFLDADFSTATPSEHLLAAIRPDEMEHVVRAVLPGEATARLLALSPGEPCLGLSRRTWHAGRVVTYALLTYPSSRFELGARYALHDSAHAETEAGSELPPGYERRPLAGTRITPPDERNRS